MQRIEQLIRRVKFDRTARARHVYGDGRDVSEFDLSLIVPMIAVPLCRDVLAGDGEQARRDELPERWDGLS